MQVSESPDTEQQTFSKSIRIIACVQFVAAATALAVLAMEWQAASMANIDVIGLISVSICLSIAGICTIASPKTHFASRVAALATLFIYFQVSLLSALFLHGDTVDQYALNRCEQLMALLYLAFYALLVRRTLILPIIHCSAILLQVLLAFLYRRDNLTAEGAQVIYLLAVTQPLYLALLGWINAQRQQAIAAQRQAATSKLTTLGMISHELRSPLQTIVGAIEVLEKKFVEWRLPRNEYRNLGRIRFSAAQLDSYLSDLLVMTREGVQLAEPERIKVDLDFLLKDMTHSYEAAAADRGTSLQVQVAEDCKHIIGDKVRIHQILNNLLSNAIKFTENGDVSIKASRPQRDDWIRFDISDNGNGIAEKDREKIWRPYVSLQLADSGSVGRGSGLGLAVVRLLVEMLGGEISLNSKVGQGSIFSVRLPLPQAHY